MFFAAPKKPKLAQGEWANWAHNEKSSGHQSYIAENVDSLARDIEGLPAPLRPVGASHSFTPLIPTDGTIISIEHLKGIESIEEHGNDQDPHVWIAAGTSLNAASKMLDERGYAFKNLGDIDVQSVIGAVATATHGTGAQLPCLAGEVQAMRLVTGTGEKIEILEDDPRLDGARVSLGALGVVTALKMTVRPRMYLNRQSKVEPLKDILATAHTRWAENRNFEFFALPFSDMGLTITHNETSSAQTPRQKKNDDTSLMQLKFLRDTLHRAPWLRKKITRAAMKLESSEDTSGKSYELLASPRNVPFKEMEYHMPPEQALDVFQEILKEVERTRPDVFFPIEMRMTAGDTAWLSPFQGGARISIALHAYYSDNHQWFFDLAEPIMREAGGRPHWGKMHSLKAPQLREIYPDFDKFLALREELDPGNRFITPKMAQLWGTE